MPPTGSGYDEGHGQNSTEERTEESFATHNFSFVISTNIIYA